ncbi:D-arabinono-1,4-lactone oxidase [Corynebacterium propinquum]
MTAHNANAPTNMTRWANWAGTQTARARLQQPSSVDELTEAIRRAASSGEVLRPLGAGHSFSALAATDDAGGTHIQLDRVRGLSSCSATTATFSAGTRLYEIPELLAPHGKALANQGDVDPQSVAGAVSTGTHGTGTGFTGFAGMVRSFRIITADGVLHDCHADATGTAGELFRLARLGLGAFGVITEVELDVVDKFCLYARHSSECFQQITTEFPERARGTDHLEFFWFPGTKNALVKDHQRIPDVGYRSRGNFGRWFSREIIDNTALHAMCEIGHRRPGWVPRLNKIAASTFGSRDWIDQAHKVFVSSRRVRFSEMEYAIGLDDAPEVLAEIAKRIDPQVSFPIEVRATAPDDVALSTAYQRESCYIAIHRYHREPYQEYFAALEPILVAAGGRPHWGKLHTLGAEQLRERYPFFDEVAALRAKIDPAGVFLNEHLRGIFGVG